jgi:hypothetical protein
VAFLLWFAGAVIGHDLVLFWLYAAVRRGLEKVGTGDGRAGRSPRVVNHLTVPAFVSGLLFLVWFPLILGLSAPAYESRVGLPLEPSLYIGRWLLVSAALFSGSALVYVARMRRAA